MSQIPGTLNPTQGTIALPLEKVDYSKYADIRLRSLRTDPPRAIFDDGDFPDRRLYLYPVPDKQQAVELWLWQPLFTYETIDDEIDLPPGYEKALRFNLAVELAAEYGKELPQSVAAQAVSSHAAIKRMNQRTGVPMRRDSRLPGSTNTPFNSRMTLR